MKCFPRDPTLREIWKKRVGRANWEPSKNSFLCHMHFEPDQLTKTENGRIKLKRDAMPSIFTETSTRKSPNKQRMQIESEEVENPVGNGAVDESEDDNYTLEYLDDCEYEVTLASRENVAKNSVIDFAKGKKNCDFAYHIVSEKDIKGLEKENIIIVSDENNKEIGKLIHNNESIIIVADENNKEIGQIVVQEDSIGRSNNHMSTKPSITVLDDHYDDIEQRMNQICNGDDVTVTRTELKALEPKVADEGQANMTIVRSQELVALNNGDEDNSINGEDAKNDPDSNIEAAMRRQKKTRRDVMKSIERTIAKLSEGTFEGVKNDQLTRSILSLTRARQKGEREKRSLGHKRSSEFELGDLHSSKKSKFTIKVTGIMQGLDNSRLSGRQERSIKSGVKEEQFAHYNGTDFVEERLRGETNQPQSRNTETSLKCDKDFAEGFEFISTEEFDKQLQQRRKTSAEEKGATLRKDDMQSALKTYTNKTKDPNRDLKQKINAQQEVISKLTNQLIIYKGLEAKLAALNLQLKAKTREIETLKGGVDKGSQMNVQEKDEDMKEKTISVLTNRVNRLKEANRRLVQKIAVESQDKKLGFHVKQKDMQIKELNWKLEKASKFLDRAEKNANTYKRKLVSLQTSLRRQKAVEERRNHFKELLIDNAKHEFSDASLRTALDIKNNCGRKCYEKLLSYDFPLPSLRTLRRRFPKEHITEEDWVEEEGPDEGGEVITGDPLQMESTENEITGTVQDIFDENNDTEDLNSSELGEHIFLQLDDEIKYEKT